MNWFAALVANTAPDQKIWPGARGVYNLRLGDLTRRALLKEVGVTPASLRAGGATHELVQGESMENICFHGRSTLVMWNRNGLAQRAPFLGYRITEGHILNGEAAHPLCG